MFLKGKKVSKRMCEYWLDIGPMKDGHLKVLPIKMPYKYVVEMFCDMMGASKTYSGKDGWDKRNYYDYWFDFRKKEVLMHEESINLLETLLKELDKAKDEKAFYEWYKVNKQALKSEYKRGKFRKE